MNMKVHQSVEQGIYVVLMLALEKDHKPVKSSVLSRILGVSDSYLKKILRKMVIAGIITSNARRDGGFQLARPVEELTINDVYHALEGEGNEMKLSGLAHQIFDEDEKLAEDEKRVVEIFDKAFDAFENELKKISISDLLFKTDYTNGKTHWSDRILESKSQTA